MEYLSGVSNGEALSNNGGLHIMRHSPCQNYTKSSSLPWLDLKVFYVQISNLHVDAKTPDSLSVTHIPLNPNTLLEVNGCNSCNGVNSILRRDRVDKKSEEATFVSTDTVRLTGSVKFEVFDEEELILYGVLEMSNSNGFNTESKNGVKRWSMSCEQGTGSGLVSNKGDSPTIEVYVAGSFAGSPIILTKSLQICSRKKNNKVSLLCAIPENEASLKGGNFGNKLQVSNLYNNKTEYEEEAEYEEHKCTGEGPPSTWMVVKNSHGSIQGCGLESGSGLVYVLVSVLESGYSSRQLPVTLGDDLSEKPPTFDLA